MSGLPKVSSIHKWVCPRPWLEKTTAGEEGLEELGRGISNQYVEFKVVS